MMHIDDRNLFLSSRRKSADIFQTEAKRFAILLQLCHQSQRRKKAATNFINFELQFRFICLMRVVDIAWAFTTIDANDFALMYNCILWFFCDFDCSILLVIKH
jgi:hypothetical protein